MRKAINDNPAVQIGILALLALLVGFLVLTRMSHKSPETSTGSTPSATSSASTTTPSVPSSDASSPADVTAVPPTSTSPPIAAGASAAAPAGKFVAGPGLPSAVVHAYNADRVVVLLVVRRNGIDDEAVKKSVESMGGAANVALFVTHAGHIARYSRIASGVNVDRVPALIVLRPRNLTHGTPTAMVSYGFRSPESVAQAIHDATYKGPTNVPYYPK